jgi:hypothetical protein
MTELPVHFEELTDLAWALVNDRLDSQGADRLQQLLDAEAAHRRIYIELMDQFASLEWERGQGGGRNIAGGRAIGQWKPEGEERPAKREMSNDQFPILNDQFSFLNDQFPAPSPEPIALPIIIQTADSPLSPLASFVGSMLLPYMIAVVCVGVGVLIASVLKVSSNAEIAASPPHSAVRDIQLPPPPEMELVGWITGMSDCRWVDPDLAPAGARVRLGGKYALAAGMMEITYTSGAKVILQGPVTYDVDSAAGGFLSVGKLTAKLEKRGERREERGEGRNLSKSPNLQSAAPSPLSSLPSALFAVRTPTATVTDLGTEFGVEVKDNGCSEVCVLKGAVDLVTRRGGRHLLLRADDIGVEAKAARVDAGSPEQDGDKITLVTPEPQRFLRALPKRPAAKRGQRVLIVSNFNLSFEGWMVSSPAGTEVVYARTAGNPGGCIETHEGQGPDFFYWIAPPEYGGNRSAAFGGQLKFDVFTTIFQSLPNVPETMANEPPVVILQGRNLRIAADQTQSAQRDKWTTLTVPLSAAGKWYRLPEAIVLDGKHTDRTPVSEDVIREVLSDLREVWIRAEYMHGRDLGRLDNVMLITPAVGEEKTKQETVAGH